MFQPADLNTAAGGNKLLWLAESILINATDYSLFHGVGRVASQ